MTQEEKQVLLKDLCARLPYGVRVQTDSTPRKMIAMDLWDINSLSKPYLRSMSSMNEEEEEEYNRLNVYEAGLFPHTEEAFNWLLEHHFDFRGLIPKGLAIEVTENNNPYKE